MNTPLMELIEWVKKESWPIPIPTLTLIEKATELLEKEREVIEKAYVAGADTIIYHRDLGHNIISKHDYYTKTFTNESK